jgi:hypothetical protein
VASQYSAYEMKDGKTRLSAATFNAIFADLDTRLVALENLQVNWEAAIEQLKAYGLVRIAEALQASYDEIDTATTSVTSAVAELQTTVSNTLTTMDGRIAGLTTETETALAGANAAITAANTAITTANAASGVALVLAICLGE